MGTGGTYYWAGGKKVPLLLSDQVVLDLGSDKAEGDRGGLDALRRVGRPLTGSLVMVSRTVAQEALGSRAAGTGTEPISQPVFRAADGTLLAVLPEVRVEASPELLDEVGRSVQNAHVTERTEERLVLVPDSGRGEDALRIANELAEAGGLDLSQARFVRVLRRPGL